MGFITAAEEETSSEILQTEMSITYYLLNLISFLTYTHKISNANTNIIHFKWIVDNQ